MNTATEPKISTLRTLQRIDAGLIQIMADGDTALAERWDARRKAQLIEHMIQRAKFERGQIKAAIDAANQECRP